MKLIFVNLEPFSGEIFSILTQTKTKIYLTETPCVERHVNFMACYATKVEL